MSGVTGFLEGVESEGIDELAEQDADHPASTPRPFTEEEKAWGAALHYSRQWFSKSAIKEPPVPMRDQAKALALIPQANGLLFSDTRAGRLKALIELMLPGERAGYVRLAQERLAQWQLAQPVETTEVASPDQPPLGPTPSETPPDPTALRPWRVPYDIVLPSSHEENPQELARAQALLREEANQDAEVLQNTLVSFNVPVEVRQEDICIGPTVVRYGIRPTGVPETKPDERDPNKRVPVHDSSGHVVYKTRTKVSRVLALQSDIALALEAKSIRMQAPVPERPYIGVEIPTKDPIIVSFNEMLRSREYQAALKKSKLSIPLGKDVMSRVRTADIRKMPHLLIAGTTGAGKSVFLKSLISGVLLHATPDEVRLALVDPKLVELGMFDGIPHLLSPVVKDIEKVVPLLQNAVDEMERRYRRFSELGVTDLESYGKLRRERLAQGDRSIENLPIILIVIDELADLMDMAADETEKLIKRLAQKARATGIHLVLATQRPSVDVITGTIKANLPTRISFMVSSAIDSRTILDQGGAERLVGRGDMLYLAGDSPEPERIQGTKIEDEVVQILVEYWREEAVRRANGLAELPIDQKNLIQLTLDPTWNLEVDLEGEKPPAKPKTATKEPALSEAQFFEHLTAYLLYDTVFVDGTPLPVKLRMLPYEDQLLAAEVIAWKIRGSAEKINSKLRTKSGPDLREELIRRGLLDRDTQQPIHASERLAPLLVECGFIDAETHERLEPLSDEKTNQQPREDQRDDQEADLLPT